MSKPTFGNILFAVVMTLAAGSSLADDVCAVLYEHADYSGDSHTVFRSQGDNGWVGNWWNDRASSVRVAEGCDIVLYENSNFNGTPLVIYQSSSNLGPLFNDHTSSYRCYCN